MLLTERISKCISHFLQILVVAETMPFIGGSKNIAAYTKDSYNALWLYILS